MENKLNNILGEFFYYPTINELIGTLIEPLKVKMLKMKQNCEQQLKLEPNFRVVSPNASIRNIQTI